MKKCNNCLDKHLIYIEAYKGGLISDLKKIDRDSNDYLAVLCKIEATEEILTIIRENYRKQII